MQALNGGKILNRVALGNEPCYAAAAKYLGIANSLRVMSDLLAKLKELEDAGQRFEFNNNLGVESEISGWHRSREKTTLQIKIKNQDETAEVKTYLESWPKSESFMWTKGLTRKNLNQACRQLVLVALRPPPAEATTPRPTSRSENALEDVY